MSKPEKLNLKRKVSEMKRSNGWEEILLVRINSEIGINSSSISLV